MELEDKYPVAFKKMPKLKQKIDICVGGAIDANLVCNSVPPGVTQNAVYVIDMQAVEAEDLTTDGFIYDEHACPKENIVLEMKDGNILNFQRNAAAAAVNGSLSHTHMQVLHRKQYSYIRRSDFVLQRCVTKFENENGSTTGYAIVAYKVSGSEELCNTELGKQMIRRNHKNQKKSKETYMRTKPSVLSKIKQLGSYMRPKEIVTAIENEAGGPIELSSPSDIPRNRMQVCNKLRQIPNRPKARNTGRDKAPDYTKLVALVQAGDFVRDFSFHRNEKKDSTIPRVFATTECNLRWIKKFCSPSSKTAVPAGIDMTYKCGPFYVTTVTVEHPLFIYRDRQDHHPGILLSIMTSATKEESDYEYMATQLSTSGVKNLIYGTDGEVAMEKAFEKVFPVDDSGLSIHLRCFSHLADDIKRYLTGRGVDAEKINEIVVTILGKEKDGVRIEGLVDAEDEETFDRLLRERMEEWPEHFNDWLKMTKGRNRSIPETIKKCMLKPVRRSANLGNPPGKFTNNTTESLNLVIKEEQHHQSLDICTFLENIKEKVFEQQKGEMIKAVYRTGEYRLCEEMQNLSVSPYDWQQMNVDQRKAILKKIFSSNVENMQRKSFDVGRPLSVSFEDPSICMNLPVTILRQLWNKAEFVYENCSISKLLSGNFCVTDYDSCHTVYFDNNKALSCHCKSFTAMAGICSHVMAVAEKNGELLQVLKSYCVRKNQFAKIVEANQPKRPGAKVHEKKRRKGANNVSKRPITCRIQLQAGEPDKKRAAIYDDELDIEKECDFKDYWHNDELFYIVHLSDREECKNAKSCVSCEMPFAKRKPTKVRGELIVSHRERYDRPVRDENGKFLRCTLTSPKHLGRKYYCAKKACLIKRHPYFWKGLLRVHQSSLHFLEENHYEYLFDELHFQRC